MKTLILLAGSLWALSARADHVQTPLRIERDPLIEIIDSVKTAREYVMSQFDSTEKYARIWYESLLAAMYDLTDMDTTLKPDAFMADINARVGFAQDAESGYETQVQLLSEAVDELTGLLARARAYKGVREEQITGGHDPDQGAYDEYIIWYQISFSRMEDERLQVISGCGNTCASLSINMGTRIKALNIRQLQMRRALQR